MRPLRKLPYTETSNHALRKNSSKRNHQNLHYYNIAVLVASMSAVAAWQHESNVITQNVNRKARGYTLWRRQPACSVVLHRPNR